MWPPPMPPAWFYPFALLLAVAEWLGRAVRALCALCAR
jgi:hypothetical protein